MVDPSVAVSRTGLCHNDVHRAASNRAAACSAEGAGSPVGHRCALVRRHHCVGARHLGVAWHTAWTAIEAEAKARGAQPERLADVKTLGVDEHIWRPSRIGTDRAVTIMVDLTRDQDGCLKSQRCKWATTPPYGSAFVASESDQALSQCRG
jgi:hypothetical protein